MGWTGHGIYDGDDTQTSVWSFLQWAEWKGGKRKWADADEDAISEAMIWKKTYQKTILTKDMKEAILFGLDKILKKMPKVKQSKIGSKYFTDDDNAIEWQMLLALFLDNGLEIPKDVYDNGVLATEFLMGEHAADFNSPSARRRILKNFIKKAEKHYHGD